MARFLIRNYGPSRQFPYKGDSICLSNDQAIETDDAEIAATLGGYESVHVSDRGAEFAAPEPPEKPKTEKPKTEKPKKKERQVTVDDPVAVHKEKFPPDEDEKQQETGGTQPPAPESTEDKNEITYAEMNYKELQVVAKDRQPPIKTSGLKKAELIQALEDYDKEG